MDLFYLLLVMCCKTVCMFYDSRVDATMSNPWWFRVEEKAFSSRKKLCNHLLPHAAIPWLIIIMMIMEMDVGTTAAATLVVQWPNLTSLSPLFFYLRIQFCMHHHHLHYYPSSLLWVPVNHHGSLCASCIMRPVQLYSCIRQNPSVRRTCSYDCWYLQRPPHWSRGGEKLRGAARFLSVRRVKASLQPILHQHKKLRRKVKWVLLLLHHLLYSFLCIISFPRDPAYAPQQY